MTSPDVGLLAPVWAGTAVADLTGDTAFLQAMLDAEAALVRAQAGLGQAPASAAEAVTRACRADGFDARDLALRARAGGNPVIPLVADLRAAVPGDAARFVHRGATSQDILDSALMLVASRAVARMLDDLLLTADCLAETAAKYRATPMAGRTLTQHAVPITFGLKAAGWRSLVLDGLDRLAAVRLPAQLGGAAGTLAAFETAAVNAINAIKETPTAYEAPATADAPAAFDAPPGFEMPAATETPATFAGPAAAPSPGTGLVAAFSRELGLAEPALPWHVLRTPVADLAAALAITIGALGKIAADVLVLARTEIGEVAEGVGGGSSAMPHKANPVRATLISGAAQQAPALAAVLLGGLAVADERPAGAWHAEWQPLRELLRIAGGAAEAAAGLVRELRVFPGRMLDNLGLSAGLVVSERVGGELGGLLGPALADRVLRQAIDRVANEGLTLEQALAAAPELEGLIDRDRLRQLTDPTGYLGASVALVDRALARRPA